MTIAQIIGAFLDYYGRHRKPPTVKFYTARLKLFLAKFGARDAESVKGLEIDEHLHAVGQAASDSTRHHNAVALTTLQSFAVREKLLAVRWFEKLEKPRMGRRERIPTAAEIAALLKDASPAFRLIYTGLSQTGARPGELCRVQIADVDWTKGAIVLLEHKTAGKTGRPRVIPIGKGFSRTLKTAIGERTAGPVFLAAHGQGWEPGSLSSMHRRLRDAAGLEKTIVLYSARHRFATELLKKKTPIKDVADLMGHASVTTTELYLHRDVTEITASQDTVPEIPGVDDSPAILPSQPDKPVSPDSPPPSNIRAA